MKYLCAFCIGRRERVKRAKVFGALGFLSALVFGTSHIIPVFKSSEGIAQETFIVFVLFSLIGFALFSLVLKSDENGNFGNSTIVWVGFLIMIAFFSGTWMIGRSKRVHGNLMEEIKNYYATLKTGAPDNKVLEQMEKQADRLNMTGITALFVIVSVTQILLFITLYFVKEKRPNYNLR